MKYKAVLVYGFAIFAMFFGSGNLVFPLLIGFSAGQYWFMSFLGLLITGIFLPFFGLFVIKLHKGDYYDFFNGAGNIARHALPFFMLSLLGCFGVVPRCITVAHGGLSHVMPDLSLAAFSAAFCLAVFFFCLKDQVMLRVLGKWLSPLLLIALSVLIAIGVYRAEGAEQIVSASGAFSSGFITAYQTMDLFAAFFFSALIFKQIQATMPEGTSHKQILKMAILPSIIGSFLLALVYMGFVYLGAHYSHMIAGADPELMLPIIITNLMGKWATVIIAVAIVASCMTTAVALNNIYARYLCYLFRCDETRFPMFLSMTTMVSFSLSLLDFRGIANFLVPLLEISYPGLIALTLVSIFMPTCKRIKKYAFWTITLLMAALSTSLS